jgi:hypothetical protein
VCWVVLRITLLLAIIDDGSMRDPREDLLVVIATARLGWSRTVQR